MTELHLRDLPNLSRRVSRKLIRRHVTITSAESLTCGMFQSVLGNTPGISAVFPGGFVTYSNQAKHHLLSIPKTVIDQNGVVSRTVAVWMACQARRIMATDLAISFTGAAGPDPLEGHPGGTVWIGIASRERSFAKLYQLSRLATLPSDRVRQRNVVRALVVQIGFKLLATVV